MVKIAGQDEEEELKWPSSKVEFCATLLPERDCEKKS